MPRYSLDFFVWTTCLLLLVVIIVTLYRRYKTNESCLSHQAACKKIASWYKNLESGWDVSLNQKKQVADHIDVALYGEITYKGMEKLVQTLQLNTTDVFYDLGSGAGKLVVYLYLTTPIQKSVGVEMIGARHEIAMHARAKLQSAGLLAETRQLDFLYTNLREVDFDDATVIYISSLCFPNELMQALSERFSKLKPGARIISAQMLHPHPRLRLVKQDFLSMSWTNTSWAYYHEVL